MTQSDPHTWELSEPHWILQLTKIPLPPPQTPLKDVGREGQYTDGAQHHGLQGLYSGRHRACKVCLAGTLRGSVTAQFSPKVWRGEGCRGKENSRGSLLLQKKALAGGEHLASSQARAWVIYTRGLTRRRETQS